MKPNFIYRTIKPVYMINTNGDISDTRNGKMIKVDQKTFNIRLETLGEKYTYVKIYRIYAFVILGSMSRINKELSKTFYKEKFSNE